MPAHNQQTTAVLAPPARCARCRQARPLRPWSPATVPAGDDVPELLACHTCRSSMAIMDGGYVPSELPAWHDTLRCLARQQADAAALPERVTVVQYRCPWCGLQRPDRTTITVHMAHCPTREQATP